MHIETFFHKCGCLGELRAMYDTYLTNREKAELRRLERSLCPDCYQQQVENQFVAKWGELPSVSGVSNKQEDYGRKVIFRMLSSGQVRQQLGKLLVSMPDLPASALLDVYTSASITGKVRMFPGMTDAERILLSAFPDLQTAYFAAYPPAAQPPANAPTQMQGQNPAPAASPNTTK